MPINASKYWFVPFLFLIVACDPIPQVENRMQYWSDETNQFFGDPRTMQDVHMWLRSHNIIYTFDDSDIINGNWTMTLEKIYPDSWRCEWIDININITVNDSREVQDHKLNESRSCWL